MLHRYAESETEQYYDHEDAVYRALWDKEGSVHWGLFDDSTGRDFLQACGNLNRFMSRQGGIDAQSKLLDVGCGSGTTAMWLSREFGCQVAGLDLSGVRIANAQESLEAQSAEVQGRTEFHKGSATDLPFAENTFTHAWSQATVYHVPDKEAVLREVYRVLQPGGAFVFDDLTKPQSNISAAAQKFVYERLLYDTDFSFGSYQQSLRDAGFEIIEAHDLSEHLKTSYECLSELSAQADAEHPEHRERFQYLEEAYRETAVAVARQELGWAMFVCRK